MNEHKHDDMSAKQPAPSRSAGEHAEGKKKVRGRRMLRLAAWSLASLLILLLATAGAGLLFLRTEQGEAWLTATLNSALAQLPGGMGASIEAFHGPLPSRAALSHILLTDEHGVWLEAESASLSLDWSAMPQAFVVADITLEQPRLLRLPEPVPSDTPEEPSTPFRPEQALTDAGNLLHNWPSWLPGIRLERLQVNRATLSEDILGKSVSASLEARASAERSGAELSLSLNRDDISCPPLVLKALFSPEADGTLSLQGSDLGLLALLPEETGQNGEVRFLLEAALSPEKLSADLSGTLRNVQSGEQEASATAQATFHLSGEKKRGEALLNLDVSPAAERLWTLTGQKGAFSALLDVQAEKSEELSLHAKADLKLSDMTWKEEVPAALFGRACALSTTATLRMGTDSLTATLEEAALLAERLQAKASGEVTLPGKTISPDARVTLHAEGMLEDSADLSPDLSGGASLTADISGTMDALSTHLALSGEKLTLPGLKLEKAHAALDVPRADIPRLLEEMPRLFAGVQVQGEAAAPEAGNVPPASPLLAGNIDSSLLANGQKLLLNSSWSVEENSGDKGPGMLLSLDRLSLHLEDNALEGSLRAHMPFSAPLPEQGSVAALAGIPLPDLDGSLRLQVRQWTPLARLSGMTITGSPLNLELKLSSRQGQGLDWQGTLERLNIKADREHIALAGLKTRLKAKNLWGRPDIDLDAGLRSFSLPGLSLARVSASVKGGEKGLQARAESHGDIRSRVSLRWKPEEIFLQTLEAEVSPALLGLAGSEGAGLRLNAPATIRFQKERVSFPSLSLSFLPSGTLALSGSWTPKKADITASLQGLDLARLGALLPDLPRGMVDGRVRVAGTLQKPSGNFMLNFKDILIPGSSLPPLDGELAGNLAVSGKGRTLNLAFTMPEKSRSALGLDTLNADLSLPLAASGSVPMPDMKGRLRGNITLSGELAQLWKLVPVADQRLSGSLHLDAVISGSPSAPLLTLAADLDNGSFADIAQGVELRHMRLHAAADRLNLKKDSGNRLEFTFSADDNRKGTVNLSGWLEPSSLALDVQGRINHLSPLRRQDASIMLSGTLAVTGTASAPSVRADITVDKGQVQLSRLPGGDIVTLPIEEPGDVKKEEVPAIPGRLNVRIHIPNQLFIRGYGLECEWKGDIRLRGPLTRPGVTGGMQAVRGTLDILGRRFKLSEGEITFDGGWPVSPVLNVVMAYSSSDVTADITLSGTASRPEILLSSEPELPKDEILSRIMFGKEANSLSHVQALQLAAGAAELAGFGGGGVMDLGRRIFGLDVLKFNSDNDGTNDSDTSRTSLEMGTYVRDNVYVGVEQGLGKESETDAVVEIELFPGVEAQAKTSSTRTEVGLEWKKNY